MNQLSNLNAKVFKQVTYNGSLQTSASTINITVENVHVNAFIEKIVFNLQSADPFFGPFLTVKILDRGNGFTGLVNGFLPVTFATISTSNTVSYPMSGAISGQNIVQNGTTITVDVNESIQDSEGLGNFYIQLSRLQGAFSVGFTMTVFYRPETTYNTKLNTRWQISDSEARVVSQTGVGTYGSSLSVFTDQTKSVANYPNARDNTSTASFGFTVFSTSPIFYFGTPVKTGRFFLGFSSDCTPNLADITFSYFNGSTFVGLLTTQVNNGCGGPGTYKFAYDGVVYVTPPADWSALSIANDPYSKFNTTIIGLGTLATNNMVKNQSMFWIQCQVGFASTASVNVSTVIPLIDPAQPMTYRRRLI